MVRTMPIAQPAQITLFEDMVVDNFAGGGGASTGIELAIGRPVDLAINHDIEAIRMHRTNHPYTKHLCESVWDIDPRKECGHRNVALLWASPDCRHHSRAKGGKPVEKAIRGLIWVTVRWMMQKRPRVVMVENVIEIMTWGPLLMDADGKEYPDPAKKGETFQGYISMISTGIAPDHPAFLEACEFLGLHPASAEARRLIDGLGYEVDYRQLVAADYGAPTIRKRFFMVARCDGEPIAWPEPTHAAPDSPEVASGERKPWRTAAEIIDWSLPCPSIFDSKKEIWRKHGVNAQRPLKDKTLSRIARGLEKYVIGNERPFVVTVNHGAGNAFRGQSVDEPLHTITAKHGYGIVTPYMTCIGQNGFTLDRSRPATAPLNTTVTKAEQCLVMPTLIQYHTEQNPAEHRGQALEAPLFTVDGANRHGLVAVQLSRFEPSEDLQAPFLMKNYGGGYKGAGSSLVEPVHTITSVDHNALVMANMVKFQQNSTGQRLDTPIQTVMPGAQRFGLVLSNLVIFRNNQFAQPHTEPLHTLTTSPAHFGESRYFMQKYYGQGTGQGMAEPFHTVTTKDRHSAVHVIMARMEFGRILPGWDRVRRFLNEYGGYNLAFNEVLLFEIGGAYYYIHDIGLRMLSPRELFMAQGFPIDYIIDRDYTGASYGKAQQVAKCGNSVAPPVVTALVRAMLPDLCGERIETMQELEGRIAI